MTTEEYNSIKEDYCKIVTKMIIKTGGLSPLISAVGTTKEDNADAIVHFYIENEYMKDDISKEEFMHRVLPKVAEGVREKINIKAVVWASEAWLRVIDGAAAEVRNWKNLPVKKEVVIIVIDSAEHHETIIKEIVRKGKQVNEDGELTDHVELLDLPEYDKGVTGKGRFTHLYKKFTENA